MTPSSNMLLQPSNVWGGSLTELSVQDKPIQVESDFPKPNILRRAFSSKKRKKSKNTEGLTVPNFPLRSSLSNPSSGNECDIQLELKEFAQQISLTNDVTNRRSVFSRKCYGSVEMLADNELEGYRNNAGRFRAETGTTCESDGELLSHATINQTVHLENPEKETRWYFKYFLGKLHQIYAGVIADKEPFVLAVVISDANNHGVNQYRAILWRKSGSQKMCIPYNQSSPLSVRKILSHFDVDRFDKSPKEIFNSEVQKDVLTLEEQEGSVNFKFGVLYAKEGQTSDEAMYNNEFGSEAFTNFVNKLGRRIKLENWEHFKGGLDTKTNTTGDYSIYTVYEGHEVMFHISTMLPFSTDNRQQIERKRHVGNDIVNIIFVDEVDTEKCGPSWRPSMMKTHFTHIFAVITYNNVRDVYRLNVFAEESVPLFGPPLPSPPEFPNSQEFIDFLLCKLINGEKAAFHTPVFAQKRIRTLEMLINNVIDKYTSEGISMLNRRGMSDIVLEQGSTISTTKQMTKNDAFISFGQRLKLNIIIRGDAPTSNITSSLLKKMPWQPEIFNTDYHSHISCGDTWGDKLIVSGDQGTFLLEENCTPHIFIEKEIHLHQLEIVDAINGMIFRFDKGKDSKLSFLQLNAIETTPFDKAKIKNLTIEKSKGCHTFSVTRKSTSPLRLLVAVGRKIQIYQWRCAPVSSSLSNWNQFTGNKMNSYFQIIRELQTFEPAQIITILEKPHVDKICIGYKNQFDLIDGKSGDTVHLYRPESNTKTRLIAAIDACDADNEAELLLCYNRTCHFQKLRRESIHPNTNSTGNFSFTWNFEPANVVFAFPYALAFTDNAVEIRLIINGNLVHTMSVPNCRLITSKHDIYFTTSADNLCKEIVERSKENISLPIKPGIHRVMANHDTNDSPGSPYSPSSPSHLHYNWNSETTPPQYIYQISIDRLSGAESARRSSDQRPSISITGCESPQQVSKSTNSQEGSQSAANNPPPIGACETTIVLVHDIQIEEQDAATDSEILETHHL